MVGTKMLEWRGCALSENNFSLNVAPCVPYSAETEWKISGGYKTASRSDGCQTRWKATIKLSRGHKRSSYVLLCSAPQFECRFFVCL